MGFHYRIVYFNLEIVREIMNFCLFLNILLIGHLPEEDRPISTPVFKKF
jgi:hypothetical protein